MPAPDRLLTWHEIKDRVRFSRQYIHLLEGRGDFPKRVQLGPGRVAWWSSSIENWLASRARGAAPRFAHLQPKPRHPAPTAEDVEALRRMASALGFELILEREAGERAMSRRAGPGVAPRLPADGVRDDAPNIASPDPTDNQPAGDLEPNLDAARRFLELLDADADRFTFQTFDDSPAKSKSLAKVYPGSIDDLSTALARLQKAGAGVFVTINATTGRRRKAVDVNRVRAVFADLDGAPLAPVLACDLEPHIIVESSPGRFHAYWIVEGVTLDQFTPLQKAIAARFGGDKSVHDLPRVMRMPGFWHQKGAPFLSRIVQVNERLPYSADAILAEFPPVAAKPRANGADISHDTGAEPLAELVRKILTGESYHGPLCALAWRHLHDGMHPGKVVLTLRGYMDASSGPRDDRWQARYNDIPRTVSTAQDKQSAESSVDHARLAEINARIQAEREQRAAEPARAAAREHPPGLLGALVDHGERRCPFTSQLPALAGAVVGLATASANRFAIHLGGDNLMTLATFLGIVGETGSGKETALNYSALIAAAGGVQPNAFASDVALHQTLAAERKDGTDARLQLVTMDEWGRALQQIAGDRAGHQRALMTKLMELRGMTIGGTLPSRKYAKSKDNLPAVPHPFVNAIFAATPRTLHDALTSADVVDGSLNRIPVIYLDPAAAQRPLDQIVTGPLPNHLATLVARARWPRVTALNAPPAGPHHVQPVEVATIQGEKRDVAGQTFILIETSKEALAALEAFRSDAHKRQRQGQFGSLWPRAFENAVKLAGICALGEAIGTDPEADPGKPVISEPTAAWAIALIKRAITETFGDLEIHLSDHEAERIQKSILRCAAKLRDKAAAEIDPIVERSAPPDKHQEMRNLKKAGWFQKRELIRAVSGGGRSSRDVVQEITVLLDVGALALHPVVWRANDRTQMRTFMTRVPGA